MMVIIAFRNVRPFGNAIFTLNGEIGQIAFNKKFAVESRPLTLHQDDWLSIIAIRYDVLHQLLRRRVQHVRPERERPEGD